MNDIKDLFKLSVAERIQLAMDLWDSVVAEDGDLPLSEEQWQEIKRRIDDHERDPSSAIEWHELRARLLSKLG